jgi:phosphoglycerate dehydrogenase-like enzyme
MKTLLVWTGGDDTSLAEALAAVDGLKVLRCRSAAESCRAMAEADGMITSVIPWNGTLMGALRASGRLSWLQVMNVGFDNLEALGLPPRLRLSTLGALGSRTVATHALSLLLALARGLLPARQAMPRSQWQTDPVRQQIRNLQDETIAILGFGPVGQALAQQVLALGARPVPLARRSREQAGIEVRPLAALAATLGDAAALVVCAPLKRETTHLVNAAVLGAMPTGALLVNVSRGAIVDTQALLAALDSGRLAGAGLDVTDPEPLPAGHALWRHPKVILTPHVAFAGSPAREQRARIDYVVENARRFASDSLPDGLVEFTPLP